jgi:predicted acetyltransferase
VNGILSGFAKEAASKLRSLVKVVKVKGTPEHLRVYKMMLGDKRIGSVKVEQRFTNPHDWKVIDSEVIPKFRGMGLGKKMYGEVMKDMPGGNLASDITLSTAAAKIWEAMGRKPGYTLAKGKQGVRKTNFEILGKEHGKMPGIASMDSRPLYRARLKRRV